MEFKSLLNHVVLNNSIYVDEDKESHNGLLIAVHFQIENSSLGRKQQIIPLWCVVSRGMLITSEFSFSDFVATLEPYVTSTSRHAPTHQCLAYR
jgi:hypothetical protein